MKGFLRGVRGIFLSPCPEQVEIIGKDTEATVFCFLKLFLRGFLPGDDTLCIPTIFISYTGEALDYKAPLLRSLHTLSEAATDVCHYFYPQVKKVQTNLGWEQEYFLVDESLYSARPDLMLTGRTLMGHDSAKNQQMDDHYFGTIPERVQAFMKDLEIQALELGIPCKTRHNEVAPNQFELAPIYEECNLAVDHNMLLMSLMKRVAHKHSFRVLLHEKPFAGVNGSGKHNNWSLSTDRGENLLNPGDTPEENAQFLLILTAVLQAVDEYQDLLRISVAGASNDHRLGGSEAPPAILSVFLGDEITGILDSIENGTPYESGEKVQFKVGVHVLPRFPKDTSDRNRTSPFAFTGNKFEFRMVGSSQSISEANIILNTAVADVLRRYADELEGTADFESALHELIKRSIREHRRIIFNGNGYEEAWVREAARRGLCNYRSTPDCVPHLLDAKNAELFRRNRVFSETELRARCEIVLDHYAKEVRIEALTLLDMLRKDVLPAVSRFTGALSATAHEKKKLCGESACRYEKTAAAELSARAAKLWDGAEKLEKAVRRIDDGRLSTESAVEICRGEILPEMETLREISDGAELIMDRAAWPYPSYGEILTSVY